MSQITEVDALPEWENFIQSLSGSLPEALACLREPSDPLARRELAALYLTCLMHGYVIRFHGDPDYPEIVPMLGHFLNLAGPVPDYNYQGTLIRGNGVYRITGNRGTCRFVDVNINAGHWAIGPNKGTLAAYSLDDLSLSSKGDFEVILSNERPPNYRGDWWRLDPDGRRINIRRASYDWLNEKDPHFAIERLDIPARRARKSKDQLAERMEQLVPWVKNAVVTWLKHMQAQRANGVVNDLKIYDYSSIGGAKGQVYQEGLFELDDDEALLIETDVPERCRYWSIMVADELFQTLDWMNRFSSINGAQAVLSSDGRFRVIISANDPGTPNWLDIGDYQNGVIQLRWNNCSSVPSPQCKLMKVHEVRGHMPSDTPTIDPSERDRLLRIRRRGAQMRNVW